MPRAEDGQGRARTGERALQALAWLEDLLLVGLLAALVVLALGQIALRQLSIVFTWADPLVRLLVFWVGMLGAVAASRANEHISIDALSRFLPPRLRRATSVLIGFFVSGVCALLAYHALRFVHLEYTRGSGPPGVLPGWAPMAVLPLGFVLIALRYALQALGRLRPGRAEAEP